MIPLRPVTEADQFWLEPAFRDYIAEIAPDVTVGPLARWWSETERTGLVIGAPEPQGFAMIREVNPANWDMGEFCILPSSRRRGVGTQAAREILAARPGTWRLGVVRAGAAAAFWAHVLQGMAAVSGLTAHPPMTRVQSLSYHFTVMGEL